MLPDPSKLAVGATKTIKDRQYVKASSGRWSLVIDQKMLDLIHKTYVAEKHSLRETKAIVNAGPLPGANIQKILEEQGWMRSHYGRNDARDAWYQRHRKAILKAHALGIDLASIERWANVQLGNRLMDDGLKVRRAGRTATAADARTNCWLTTQQVVSWNSFLEVDVDELTFMEYRVLAHKLTALVLIKFGLSKSAGQHVDHKLSRYYGYHTDDSWPVHGYGQINVKRKVIVPLPVLCHPENLRIVSAHVNAKKHYNSTLTVKELNARVMRSELRITKLKYHRELDSLLRYLGITPLEI